MEGLKEKKKEKVDQLDLNVEKKKTIILKVDRHSRSLRKINRYKYNQFKFKKKKKKRLTIKLS